MVEIENIILESCTDPGYFDKLTSIEKFIQEQLEPFYKDILIEYIQKEWDDCGMIRDQINSKGDSYFYHNYTEVPVPWYIFKTFYDSGDCWCGICHEYL